jgi:hypothetical protein
MWDPVRANGRDPEGSPLNKEADQPSEGVI